MVWGWGGMGREVALPLSLQELASFLQVTEGIRGPSQVHGAEVEGMVVRGRHRPLGNSQG